MFSRLQICAVAILTGVFLAASYSPVFAMTATCAAIEGIDTNNDGTVDLNEAKQAATATFDRLDKNKDGTLSPKELQGRFSKRQLGAADTNHEGTLSKDEYLAAVEARFKAADVNGDGTVSCREAHSVAGHALLRLLK